MSRKKKAKRAKYPHVQKTDYLRAVSNKIHQTNPTEDIIFNTIRDVYSTAYSAGYQRKHDETVRIRAKREQRLKEGFNQFKDELDDLIHEKSNNQSK